MKKNKITILFGPPGSGKGTLAAQCVQELGWIQLSPGNLCREQIALHTELGKKIDLYLQQGYLVPDDIIVKLVESWLHSQETLPKGILFDGYPRTKNQAILLYDLWKNKLQAFEMILIKVAIDSKLLIDRILNRLTCSNSNCATVSSLKMLDPIVLQTMKCPRCGSPLVHRSDDTEQSLQQRLKLYYQYEQDIIAFYVDKGFVFHEIDGSQSPQQVFENFKQIVLV